MDWVWGGTVLASCFWARCPIQPANNHPHLRVRGTAQNSLNTCTHMHSRYQINHVTTKQKNSKLLPFELTPEMRVESKSSRAKRAQDYSRGGIAISKMMAGANTIEWNHKLTQIQFSPKWWLRKHANFWKIYRSWAPVFLKARKHLFLRHFSRQIVSRSVQYY